MFLKRISTRFVTPSKIDLFFIYLFEKQFVIVSVCSTRKYVCPTTNCTRSYSNKSSVLQHLRYECQKNPQFCCTICFKTFFRKTNLKSHMVLMHQRLDL